MAKNLKDVSKESCGLSHEGNPVLEEINTSCLMRIADAVEILTKKYEALEKDVKYYSGGFFQRGQKIAELQKSNSALRGVITRMKNRKEK